jgi:hypothetical protein
MSEKLECNKAGHNCSGKVGYWYRPSDGRSFPYCEKHAADSQRNYERVAEVAQTERRK